MKAESPTFHLMKIQVHLESLREVMLFGVAYNYSVT